MKNEMLFNEREPSQQGEEKGEQSKMEDNPGTRSRSQRQYRGEAESRLRLYSELKPLEQELAKVIAQTPIKALSDFPTEEFWRLLMDGKRQGGGKSAFDIGEKGEPGYMAAMMRGFTLMLQSVGKPLTPELFEHLHDACVKGVLMKPQADASIEPSPESYLRQRFRDNSTQGVQFEVEESTWSDAGYQELGEKYRHRDKGDVSYDGKGNPVGWVLQDSPEAMVGPGVRKKKTMQLRGLVRDACLSVAATILSRYPREIQRASSTEERLLAIIRCCQDLEQVHLFWDGNIRTIAFVVLNKLLIENDLSPTILEEPNIFDCKNVDEIREAIKAGQETFARHKKTG